jgi:hypothetical protein
MLEFLREKKGGERMEIKKIIFLDDTYFEDCTLSNDIPKEIAEVSSSFVKITNNKSTIQYVNLDYIQIIIPKNLKVISS